MLKPMKIGIMGLGTVGSGVYRILHNNAPAIAERAGRPIIIKRILVRNPEKARMVSVPPELLTSDPGQILNDPEIDLVVEVMGGLHPAREYLSQAISNGKHVVSANKELIAKEGRPLLDAATTQGVYFLFEASVAGGIPIVKALRDSLAGNQMRELMGIINGTTNYILTRMTREGMEFEEALKEAQAQGYAEADPAADVDGLDAAYKLVILTSLAFGTRVSADKIYVEGIRRISQIDIAYARELGYVIKLLAVSKANHGGVDVRVHPAFIPQDHPLASVSDSFNAIFVRGDAVGDLMFYGRGAGDLPTGSAVVGDIIEVARHIDGNSAGRACSCYYDLPLVSVGETTAKYYIRTEVKDQPGVLSQIAGAFGREDVSLASVIQKGRGVHPVTLVFVTHEVQDANLRRALAQISELPMVEKVSSVIRVEGERGGKNDGTTL